MISNPGHIFLDGRWYMIEWAQYQKALANPFAAKLGTGAGSYDDLEDWSAWVMDDWTAGLGKAATEGGMLYSELDTRFRNKLMLPGQIRLAGYPKQAGISPRHYMPGIISGEIPVGDAHEVKELVIKVGVNGLNEDDFVWVMLNANAGVSATVQAYTEFDEGAAIDAGSITVPDEWPGWYFYKATLDTTDDEVNYISVKPSSTDDTIYVPYTTVSGGAESNGAAYGVGADGTWRALNKYCYYISGSASIDAWSRDSGNIFFHRFANTELPSYLFAVSYENFHSVTGNVSDGYGIPLASGTYPTGHTLPPTDTAVFDGKLYVAYGESGLRSWTGTGATANVGVNSTYLLAYNGFLYRSYGADIYYTADGTTWSGPFTMGSNDYAITAMEGSGIDNGVYVTTTESLWLFETGDIPVHKFAFGNIDQDNGVGMVNYNGDLYIPHSHGVLRYTSTDNASEMGVSKEEDLPASRLGRIKAMIRANSYLFALHCAGTGGNQSSILAYDGQAWHHVASLPAEIVGVSLFHDRETSTLWVSTVYGLLFYMYLPDQSLNPLRDAVYTYAPFGWAETDWFDADLKEIIKDVESVFIAGDNLNLGGVDVYWQDADSTDWEHLALFTSTGEVAWSDFTTRPQTRKIKLGFRMKTSDNSQTPVIEAIRLKFHNMVNDRWRWQIVLRVSDGIQMWDGSITTNTADSMRLHVDGMVRQTLPIRFIDIDSNLYNVKVQNAIETLEKLERVNEGGRYDSKYSLTIAQV